jgi:hypothetical protein
VIFGSNLSEQVPSFTWNWLNALIDMWDDWIRERREKEGGGPAIQ